jgi:hypothetical protein
VVQEGGREADEGKTSTTSLDPPPPSLPTPTDSFAFDMSAFGGALIDPRPPAPAPDPFAFDMSAFGGAMGRNGPGTPGQADPYAFDPSAFGGGAGVADSAAASSDPYAFDPSAFEAGTPDPAPKAAPADPFAFNPGAFDGMSQPHVSHPVVSAGDPYAFSMEAFSAKPPGKSPGGGVDPFSFDMSAFESPQTPSAATLEGPKPPSIRVGPEDPEPPPHPSTPPRSSVRPPQSAQKPQPPVREIPKPPKADFRPLTPAEIARLQAGLIPPSPEPRSDSEEDEGGGGVRYGVFGCGEEAGAVARSVVEISHCVASGRPGSISDATALDSAAQHCAASIQVSFSRGVRISGFWMS